MTEAEVVVTVPKLLLSRITSYPVTPTLSVDAAQPSVNDIIVTFDPATLVGIDGAVVSTAGPMVKVVEAIALLLGYSNTRADQTPAVENDRVAVILVGPSTPDAVPAEP